MTMTATIRTADALRRAEPSRIARIDIVTDLGAAEAAWRTLETSGQFFTAYQRFDLLQSWQHEVGARDGAAPLLAIAYNGERHPLMLLPLAITRTCGLAVASFMGGKHTTFNMALWDRGFAATATRGDVQFVLGELRRQGVADVLALMRQPLRWDDLTNPLALIRHQPSVNDCPVLRVEQGTAPGALIPDSLRRRLKPKERKLTSLPGYRYGLASDDAEITRLLAWFFEVKPVRMAEQRLPNVFAAPGVADFIRQACLTRRADGGRLIDIHSLVCDDEIIALYAGVDDGRRFSMMFNTYTLSDNQRQSPGLILIRNIVEYYAARGYRAFDLGTGSDGYKRNFCKQDEAMFDSFIGLSASGHVAAAAMSTASRAKHVVKHDQTLLRLADRLRKAVRS